jgi:hypothetical protein
VSYQETLLNCHHHQIVETFLKRAPSNFSCQEAKLYF